MARLFAVSIFALVCITSVGAQITLDRLFDGIATGTTMGGCDNWLDDLDGPDSGWLQDAIDSSSVAITALDSYRGMITGDTNSPRTKALIADAIQLWFAIPTSGMTFDQLSQNDQGNIKTVRENIAKVFDWLNGNTRLWQTVYLFCDSTFLTQQASTDFARDKDGNTVEKDGNTLTIADVPTLNQKLRGSNVAWYAENSPFAGYYFQPANSGGNFCSAPPPVGQEPPFGLTSDLTQLVPTKAGGLRLQLPTNANAFTLCPYAFTKPNTGMLYINAFPNINVGTDLNMALPLSATFYHEAYHVVLTTGFLQGSEGANKEYYGLGDCEKIAQVDGPRSRKNPESYVYFTAAMYSLVGATATAATNEAPFTQNWNFNGANFEAQTVPSPDMP